MDTNTALNAILAHSRHLGARWAHEQAIEVARAAILAEIPAVEAGLPPAAPRPDGRYYDSDVQAHYVAEAARTSALRELRHVATEPGRLLRRDFSTAADLGRNGVADGVAARVLAVLAGPCAWDDGPEWATAPEVPAEALAAMVPEGHDPRGVGPIRPAPGWTLHHLSRWPAAAGYTIQVNYEGTPVARWAPDGGDLRIMAWDEEVAREAAAKAGYEGSTYTQLPPGWKEGDPV